jgi:hypothetical protein
MWKGINAIASPLCSKPRIVIRLNLFLVQLRNHSDLLYFAATANWGLMSTILRDYGLARLDCNSSLSTPFLIYDHMRLNASWHFYRLSLRLLFVKKLLY